VHRHDPDVVTDRPDPSHISTSYVERQNWTVQTTMGLLIDAEKKAA